MGKLPLPFTRETDRSLREINRRDFRMRKPATEGERFVTRPAAGDQNTPRNRMVGPPHGVDPLHWSNRPSPIELSDPGNSRIGKFAWYVFLTFLEVFDSIRFPTLINMPQNSPLTPVLTRGRAFQASEGRRNGRRGKKRTYLWSVRPTWRLLNE